MLAQLVADALMMAVWRRDKPEAVMRPLIKAVNVPVPPRQYWLGGKPDASLPLMSLSEITPHLSDKRSAVSIHLGYRFVPSRNTVPRYTPQLLRKNLGILSAFAYASGSDLVGSGSRGEIGNICHLCYVSKS